MITGPCTPATQNLEFDQIRQKWDSTVGEFYGTTMVDSNGFGSEGNSSYNLLKLLVNQKLNKPLDEAWDLKQSEVLRVNNAIEKLHNNIKNKPFLNPVAEVLLSGESLSRKDPILREFYTGLNEAQNFSRVKELNKSDRMNKVRAFIRNELIARGVQGKYTSIGITHARRIDNMNNQLRLSSSPDEKNALQGELAELISADRALGEKGSQTAFDQFIELLELPSVKTVKGKKMNVASYDPQSKTFYKIERGKYSNNIQRAAIEAKSYLSDMGAANLNGLRFLKESIKLKYSANSQDGINKDQVERLTRSLDEAIVRLESSIKDGGYYPHTAVGDMIAVRTSIYDQLTKFNANPETQRFNAEAQEAINKTIDVINSVNPERMPDNLKARNENITTLYNENPLYVLEQYGNEAIAFNKINHVQKSYIKALKKIPYMDASKDSELAYMNGMKTYINDLFTVATEGYRGRPAWVNDVNNLITAAMTASTMGFNATGALKNVGSLIHYYSHVGPMQIINARKALTKGGRLHQLLSQAEKEEGFTFGQIGKSLVVEGLISEEQSKRHSFELNLKTGKIEVDGSPIRDNAMFAKDWTLDKLLVFHSMTENFVRQHMYRTSFVNKMLQLRSQPEYYSKIGEAEAVRQSKAHALQDINTFAFEYALHAKSKASRGPTIGKMVDETSEGYISRDMKAVGSLLSQQTLHMLHYPMSLAETHGRKLKGIGESIMAKQWDSDEMAFAMRFAGLYLGLQGFNVVTNLNFNNIFENTTLEMIKGVYDDITKYDQPNKKTFGVLNRFTGPMVGKVEHALNMAGIYGMQKSDIEKILLGNAELRDTKGMTEKTRYQIATILGKMTNKVGPELQEGRGWEAFRHIINAYPSKETRKANKFLFNRGDKSVQRGRSYSTRGVMRELGQLRGA